MTQIYIHKYALKGLWLRYNPRYEQKNWALTIISIGEIENEWVAMVYKLPLQVGLWIYIPKRGSKTVRLPSLKIKECLCKKAKFYFVLPIPWISLSKGDDVMPDFSLAELQRSLADVFEMYHTNQWSFLSPYGKITIIVLGIFMAIGIPGNILLLILSERLSKDFSTVTTPTVSLSNCIIFG